MHRPTPPRGDTTAPAPWSRRRWLRAAALWPAAAWWPATAWPAPLAGAAPAAVGAAAAGTPAQPLADVLDRPALPARLASRPSLLRLARAGDRLVAVGERGLVLLSDDDGRQWRQARVPVSVTLTGVQFIDARRGWAIGHAAVVLHTQDGGDSWALQFDGRRLPDGPANPLLDLLMLDAQHGWAVGAYGLALATQDGGRQWTPQHAGLPNPKGMHLYALARLGDVLFIAGEQGLLMRLAAQPRGAAQGTSLGNSQGSSEGAPPAPPPATPPSGASLVPTPYRGSYFTLCALPDGALLLGGLRGTVLRHRPGGDFTPLDSGTTQAIVSCTVLDGQRIALVDQSGRVWAGAVPTDGAVPPRFSALPAEAGRRWVAVARARDGALVGAGTTGVGRLAAGGAGDRA